MDAPVPRKLVAICLTTLALAGCGPPEIETGMAPSARLWGAAGGKVVGSTFAAHWGSDPSTASDLDAATAGASFFFQSPKDVMIACSAGFRFGVMLVGKPKEQRDRYSAPWRFIGRAGYGCWAWADDPGSVGRQMNLALGFDCRLSEVGLFGFEGTWMFMLDTQESEDSLVGVGAFVLKYTAEF